MGVTRSSSLAKAVTWRLLASLTTVGIVLLLSGELELALFVGGIEAVAKFIVFYGHERLWSLIRWGHPPPSIDEEDYASSSYSEGENVNHLTD